MNWSKREAEIFIFTFHSKINLMYSFVCLYLRESVSILHSKSSTMDVFHSHICFWSHPNLRPISYHQLIPGLLLDVTEKNIYAYLDYAYLLSHLSLHFCYIIIWNPLVSTVSVRTYSTLRVSYYIPTSSFYSLTNL